VVSHAIHPRTAWPYSGCQFCGFSSTYAYMIRPRKPNSTWWHIWERGVLGRQPRHCICKNASRDLSAVADFYRATLCVSEVFAVARCPSVRSFVHHVDALYPDGWSYRQTFLSVPVPNSKRERKIEGVGKFCDFRLKSPSICTVKIITAEVLTCVTLFCPVFWHAWGVPR